MSNDSMGNLEKLGILVIVILVVVVGVVAITPSETLLGGEGTAVLPAHGGEVAPLPLERPHELREGPGARRTVAELPDEPVLPDWPIDPPQDAPEVVPTPPENHANLGQRNTTPSDPVEPVKPATAAPRFREVTVQKGDNLWRIAERELGDGSQWKVIAAANPSVDPDRLRTGQTLRIPLETASAAPALREPARDERTYVVQKDDTAMGLSKKFYGTVRHYRMLLRHNGISAEELRAGMTIEIPPVPETSSDAAPAGSTSGRTYEVQKGDVPSRIAAEQLGDASRWREILELNGIDSANDLPAGRRIRLPE